MLGYVNVLKCTIYSNLVNSKVAKFAKQHATGQQISHYLEKIIKMEKEGGV